MERPIVSADMLIQLLSPPRFDHSEQNAYLGTVPVLTNLSSTVSSATGREHEVSTVRLIVSSLTFALDRDAAAAMICSALNGSDGPAWIPEEVTWDNGTIEPNSQNLDLLARCIKASPKLIDSLKGWATEFIQVFLMPIKNKSRSRTPRTNADDTASRDQRGLLRQVWERDGYRCLLTDKVDESAPPAVLYQLIDMQSGEFPEYLECAHIIPFSINGKTVTLDWITRWTGGELNAPWLLGGSQVNGVWNAMLLDPAAHKDYDRHRWGIEALQSSDGDFTYRSVWVAENDFPRFRFRPRELCFAEFGTNVQLPRPDPVLCNLHLAVSRILYMSGAGEVIDHVLQDIEDVCMEGARFGFGGMKDNVALFLLQSRLSYLVAHENDVESPVEAIESFVNAH